MEAQRRKHIKYPQNLCFQVLPPTSLLVVLDIDDSRLELPGRDLAVEQDVRLTVRAVLELGKAKVGRHEADDGGATPDVAALAREVPARGVEQLRGEVDHGDLGDVVGGAADAGAEGAEAHGGGLGDDGVGDGAEGAGVHERDEDAEDGLGVVGRRVLLDRRTDAEDEEKGDVGDGAPEVDGSTAEPRCEEQGSNVGDELKARIDQVELEGTAGIDTGL